MRLGSSASPTTAVPSVDFIRPVSANSRHVRPDPEGPSIAISEPGSAANETPRKAQPRGPLSPRPLTATESPRAVAPFPGTVPPIPWIYLN